MSSIDAGVPSCKSEVIPLPPDFAPTLPPGTETLWFAPGMFDSSAHDYFTYQFVLNFDAAQDVTSAKLERVLLDYYAGLMTSVAKGKKRLHAAGATAVEVQPSQSPHEAFSCGMIECPASVKFFDASIRTVDEFVTGETLELRVLMAVSPTMVAAHVSPSKNWDRTNPVLTLPCSLTAP